MALLKTVFWMASSEVRVSSGIRTRIVYGRPLAISGTVVATPSRIEVASSATSVGCKAQPIRNRWVHLEVCRRAADGVLDPVLHFRDTRDLADGIAHLRSQLL